MAGYEDVDRNLATRLGVDTPVSPSNREGEAEIEKTAEDVRTLWIDVDGQLGRHKEWRAVVQENHVERYPECPLEGPDTVMRILKHMLRFGGSPRGWLEMWCREHHMDRKDRTCPSRSSRDLSLVPHSELDATSCPRRRRRQAASLQGQLDDACASLNWLAGYRLDIGERTKPPAPMKMDTIARVEGLIEMAQPTPGDDVVHDFKECLKLLLNNRDVYSQNPAGRTLASYRKEAVSLPDDAGEAQDFTTFGCEACRLLAEEEGVQMLRDPVEAKQNLIDPGFSLCSDPIFKQERGKYVGFIELLRSRHPCTFRDFAARRNDALLCVEEGAEKRWE